MVPCARGSGLASQQRRWAGRVRTSVYPADAVVILVPFSEPVFSEGVHGEDAPEILNRNCVGLCSSALPSFCGFGGGFARE